MLAILQEKDLKMQNRSHPKTLACLLLSIDAMAIVLITSIAYFSAEIARLKTQTSSLQQSPFGQEGNSSLTLQLLQQIQQNVSDAMRKQEGRWGERGRGRGERGPTNMIRVFIEALWEMSFMT